MTRLSSLIIDHNSNFFISFLQDLLTLPALPHVKTRSSCVSLGLDSVSVDLDPDSWTSTAGKAVTSVPHVIHATQVHF